MEFRSSAFDALPTMVLFLFLFQACPAELLIRSVLARHRPCDTANFTYTLLEAFKD